MHGFRGRLLLLVVVSSAGLMGWKPVAPPATAQVTTCASEEPSDPLELNHISAVGLFKTIAMEKDVVVCRDTGGEIALIRDVEIFIDVIERVDGKGQAIITDVRVARWDCEKDFQDGTVGCSGGEIPLQVPAGDPLDGCAETHPASSSQPLGLVEMATANDGGLVKTVKVERDVLTCPHPDTPGEGRPAHLYLFTDIIEVKSRTATGALTFKTTQMSSLGILCGRSEEEVGFAPCMRFTPLAALG